MPRVLISDKLGAPGLELLREAGIELDERHGLKGDALLEAVRGADGMIVRSETRVTAEMLEKPRQAQGRGAGGVGVDSIDVAAATRRGIVVMNTPAATPSAPRSTPSPCSCRWPGTSRPRTRTCAPLPPSGNGRSSLASNWPAPHWASSAWGASAERSRGGRPGLDMKVIGFDPVLAPERAAQLGVEASPSLGSFCPKVDFLTVHTPLSEQTKDLIGAKEIRADAQGDTPPQLRRAAASSMKPPLRKACVPAPGRRGAGRVHHRAAAGRPSAPQGAHVIFTPHLGASTVEAQESGGAEAGHFSSISSQGHRAVRREHGRGRIARSWRVACVRDMARRLGLMHAQMCQARRATRRSCTIAAKSRGAAPSW